MNSKTNRLAFLAIAMGVALPMTAWGEEAKESTASPKTTINIDGTGETVSFIVRPQNLGQNIRIKAPVGFEVSPTEIPAGTKQQDVTVTYIGYGNRTEGKLILKSGETKQYIKLVGNGTPLKVKDNLDKVATDKAENGKALNKTFCIGKNGYTYEFKLASNEDGFDFMPFVVDANGNGVKLYVSDSEFGYFNARNKRGFSNPSTNGLAGGTGRFYNNDGKSHVYRIAVTPTNYAFVYRDGIAVDTLNLAMLSPQTGFADGKGEMSENLLRNGDFEGGYTCIPNDKILARMEGWDIVIGDRWNSEQYIDNQEMSAEIDNDNHVFRIRPYKWGGSHWGDGSIEQIVDVVPNETYTLEALAHGGTSAKRGNTGRIVISEVQDRSKKTETVIASDSWEMYSLNHTASPECKQLSISFAVGKGSYNTDIKPVYVDNARLVGTACTYKPKYGYENNNATIEYVAFDNSGAYAPPAPAIEVYIK